MQLELIGSLFLILAVALLVAIFISRPFMRRDLAAQSAVPDSEQKREHLRSSLMAERDRVLNALQELDFDHTLGKIPAEDYPQQRAALLSTGAEVLRRLDALQPVSGLRAGASVEDRIEAAVAARRADATRRGGRQAEPAPAGVEMAAANGASKSSHSDPIEDIIASRKRERNESSAGFCPRCGRPVQKSDKFCSKCGSSL